MTENFDKICRLCMTQAEKLLPLFRQDENLPERVMCLSPGLKVSSMIMKQIVIDYCASGVFLCYFIHSLEVCKNEKVQDTIELYYVNQVE